MLGLLSPHEWRERVALQSNGRFQTVDEFLKAAAAAGCQLERVTSRGPVGKRDIVLISMIRNEAVRLHEFLNHYRKLGVDRFIIIDNASTDESGNILGAANDVDLWLARGPYRTGRLLWLTALLHAFALNRWAVIVDADEFLVYSGMKSHDLHALAEWLQRSGRNRLRANMIDVFGKKPIRETEWPKGDALAETWFFDPHSYEFRGNRIRGGPRNRLLSTTEAPFDNALGKNPLAQFDSASALTNIHNPYPYHLNSGPRFAALLHIKFTSDFVTLVDRAISENQFWQNSEEYRIYQRALCENPDLSLYNDDSRRYEGPSSLISAGLMKRIPWGRARRPNRRRYSLRHEIHAMVRQVAGPDFSKLRRT